MPFLLLLLLTLACLPVPWPPSFFGMNPSRSAALTGLAMAGVVGSAFVLARWTRRRLLHDPFHREEILQRYGSLRLGHLFGLFLVYGLALTVLGWGWSVQHVFTADSWEQVLQEPGNGYLARMYVGIEAIILAPFLAALVLSWACFYDVERTLHDTSHPLSSASPFWGRWAYVGFHVRQNLALILPPLVLFILTQGLLRRYPELDTDPRFQAASYAVLLGILCTMPWIFRLVLGLRPLPEGPLRDQLLQAAGRLNFRCSNLLLWPTRGCVANAMVVGVLPRVRYVVFTDRLLSELAPDEVEAVFGHEVGHVKHHHMLYYLGFLLLSLAVLAAAWLAVFGETGDHKPDTLWSMVPLVPVFGAYVFVVFGFLSRRCERQADIYGCRAISCAQLQCPGHETGVLPAPGGHGLCATGIHTFVRALEKVALLNGISRSKPGWLSSWRHSTIARRVEFLQQMLADPALEPRFQRTVFLVKWGLLVGLSALLMVLWVTKE